MGNVVNLDTPDWTPGQVARWLSEQADEGDIERVLVVIEYTEDHDEEDGILFQHMWSKSTREGLMYLTTWTYRKIVERYFG